MYLDPRLSAIVSKHSQHQPEFKLQPEEKQVAFLMVRCWEWVTASSTTKFSSTALECLLRAHQVEEHLTQTDHSL